MKATFTRLESRRKGEELSRQVAGTCAALKPAERGFARGVQASSSAPPLPGAHSPGHAGISPVVPVLLHRMQRAFLTLPLRPPCFNPMINKV